MIHLKIWPKKMISKIFNKEVILYIIFGILTTIVNYVVYILMRNFLDILSSNLIAWFISVLFAYVTNRRYVFNASNNIKKEILSFYSSRVFTLIIESILMLIIWQLLLSSFISEKIFKIIANIIVIILNYILSKFLVFKKGSC